MPIDDLASDLEVLVVDDEAGIRELLTGYFRTRGFRVAGAQDGRAAITTLQRAEGRFGLVVTDLNLPGADGFAVLQAARQANPDCFVVIITGYASLDSAIRAVRVGAHDYLTKPFSMGQLDVILSRIGKQIAEGRDAEAPAGRVERISQQQTGARQPYAGGSAADARRGTGQGTGPRISVSTVTSAAVAPDADAVIEAEVLSSDRTTTSRRSASGPVLSVDERLGRLEAAFGRIEALLLQGRQP